MQQTRQHPKIRVRVAQSIVLVALAVFGLSLVARPLGELAVGDAPGRELFDAAVVALPLALLLAMWIAGPIRRQIADQEAMLVAQHEELVGALERQEFNARVTRGLELAEDEPGALEVLRRSLPLAAGDHPAEILLADHSHAHMERVATVGGDDGDGPGCGVASPAGCPAVRYGRPMSFTSGAEIDACPHLQLRGDDAAVCAPIAVMGQPIGVVHATGAVDDPPGHRVEANVQAMAAVAGNRLGMLRALEKRERQATTDPLTGLVNRRELEDRARDMAVTEARVAVVIIDLDRFKELNDTHGHDAGDSALRTFARVASDGLRPDDVAARYGGEEFVLLLPGVDATGAVRVVERLRVALSDTIERGGLPRFTFSAGLVDAEPPFELAELISRADEALLEAKNTGRDRIVARSRANPEPPHAPAAAATVGGVDRAADHPARGHRPTVFRGSGDPDQLPPPPLRSVSGEGD